MAESAPRGDGVQLQMVRMEDRTARRLDAARPPHARIPPVVVEADYDVLAHRVGVQPPPDERQVVEVEVPGEEA